MVGRPAWCRMMWPTSIVKKSFDSRENFASIFGVNDRKYKLSIDSSVPDQEAVSRDCQAIKDLCDLDKEAEIAMHEQALPSIYTLQPCTPREVSAIILKIIYMLPFLSLLGSIF